MDDRRLKLMLFLKSHIFRELRLDPIPTVATVTAYFNGIICWYTMWRNRIGVLAMQVLEFVCLNCGDQSVFGVRSSTCM